MISIRSASTMFSHGRHGGPRLPRFRPTATAGTIRQETDAKDLPTTTTARRPLTSLANRRYLKKTQMAWEQSQSDGLSGRYRPGGEHRMPSLLTAKAMPTGFSSMDNEVLLTIAEMGNHSARIEVLKRHIMAVDGVDYIEATKTFEKIAAKNQEGHTLAALPYQIGILVALTAGFGSIPLVFHLDTALWFNHHFVTQDIPEPSELDTALEIGGWTWNWMEPALGTASFVLLCLQFSREQIKNLGIKPYTAKMKELRSQKLAQSFPQYDASIIQEFVETDPMM